MSLPLHPAAHMLKKPNSILPLIVALLACVTAPGQTVTYLLPSSHSAERGQLVSVHVETDDAGTLTRAAWPTSRIDWLYVRAPGTQENREDHGPADADQDFINVLPTRPGVTLIGLDTSPETVNVQGGKLQAFMKRTGLDQAHEGLAKSITENDQVPIRRLESAKTLVRVRPPGDQPPANRSPHSAIAQSKSGQTVEIRPLADPTMVVVGSDLPLRAYVLGSSCGGVTLLATSVATGQTQEVLTDSSGLCHFRVNALGVWRVEFHEIKEQEDDSGADWTLYSATLTFEVTRDATGTPGAPPPRGRE